VPQFRLGHADRKGSGSRDAGTHKRYVEDVPMFYRVIVGLICAQLLSSVAFADNGFKEGGKEVGQGFKKMGKATGTATKKSGKAIGKAFKKSGQATGKAFKEAGKETGKAVKGK